MKIGSAVERAADLFASVSDLEKIYKRHKETAVSQDEATQKVEEVKLANTQTTFEMMDRHNQIVKKSQELNNKLAKKRAIERAAQKNVEEHRELLAEMAINNAERSDLLKAASLKRQQSKI